MRPERSNQSDMSASWKFVNAAVEKAHEERTARPLFETSVIACGAFLYLNDPGGFHDQLADLKRRFGSIVSKDWHGRVHAEVKRQKIADKELASAAKTSTSTDLDAAETNVPLPETTAHAFGLNEYFTDPSPQNKWVLFRLLNREYSLVPVAG